MCIRDSVYTETCPHYLAYDNTRMDECGAFAKCNPPIRPRDNLERLWDHVLNGNIDVIGTDHGPYSEQEKLEADNIWDALPGFGGVELMLTIMITEGYVKRDVYKRQTLSGYLMEQLGYIPGQTGLPITVVTAEADFEVEGMDERVISYVKMTLKETKKEEAAEEV